MITTTIIEEVDAKKGVLEQSPDSALNDSERFQKVSDDTILDTKTDLMWAAHDNGNDIGWLDAERYCKDFAGGGFSDWRMATQKELQTLFTAENKNANGFFITNLINITDCCSWASDVSLNSAAIFSFKTGNRPWGYKADTYKLRALPVRSVIKNNNAAN